MLLENEKKVKIRVKKGYTLHIGGEYYVEGEVLDANPSQIEDQLWKFDYIKEQPVVEKTNIENTDIGSTENTIKTENGETGTNNGVKKKRLVKHIKD